MGFSGGGGGGGVSTPAFAFGTAAARPAAAAGNSGTAYYATDTGEVTFSNGVAWNTIQQTSATKLFVNGIEGIAGASWVLSRNGANALSIGGVTGLLVDIPTAGRGLAVAEGADAKQGLAVLVGGAVTVANANVLATSRIFVDNNVSGGTPGFLRISARTPGTSFTILSSSGTDTSSVAFEIFEVG